MSSAQRPVLVIFGAIALICAIAGLRALLAPKELVNWETDLAKARAESSPAGRPMLLYFTASWCAPCQRMKTTTFADEEVARQMKKFIAVKIDELVFPDAIKEFSVDGFPTFVIAGADGKTAARIDGYQESADFLAFLARADEAIGRAASTRSAATRAK